jgi:Xaa-Pro aminopeptidase
MPNAILLVGDSDQNANLYYATHFLAEGVVYFSVDGKGTLITSGMEAGRARKEAQVDEIKTLEDYNFMTILKETEDRRRALPIVIARALKDSGVSEVAVDARFPLMMAEYLRGEGIELHVDPELLEAQRRQKSPEEIAAIEEAQRINERVTGKAIEMFAQSEVHNGILHYNGIPLTSERVRTDMEIDFLKDGMENSHGMIVAGGKDAADPHSSGAGPFRAGEAIVMDIFPRSKKTRYWADMTRTISKGEPSDELMKMYETVRRSQEAAFAQIRAGANGKDVHDAVVEVLKEAGYDGTNGGPRMNHSTGHGVGLSIHEAPGLGYTDVELLENEVVTVEPGLYDPEIGGVRIEDMVVVTRDGYRNLTQFPKTFVI